MEENKKPQVTYGLVIKLFYLLFGAGAIIIAVCIGIMNNDLKTWLLAIGFAAFGGAACGVLAHMIISLVRKDRPKDKYKLVSGLIYILFFAVATIAFIASGFEFAPTHGTKAWIIAFVAAYGAAAVYGTIAKLIVMLVKAKKENKESAAGAENTEK